MALGSLGSFAEHAKDFYLNFMYEPMHAWVTLYTVVFAAICFINEDTSMHGQWVYHLTTQRVCFVQDLLKYYTEI